MNKAEYSMKFTKGKLEFAIIELLDKKGYSHVLGQDIQHEPTEVLIKKDCQY